MQTLITINQISKKIKNYSKRFYSWIKNLHKNKLKKTFTNIKKQISPWGHIIVLGITCFIFLYYPIGGWLIHNTDTPIYEPKNQNNNLHVIDAISHLVNQEVRQKIWTPNLPIIFPSYFLDNMPNFQLGVISAISTTANSLKQLKYNSVNTSVKDNLTEAAELFQYPGTIWLISPQNHLLPATSSNTQYKKAKRKLDDVNKEIASNKAVIPFSVDNFTIMISYIKKDLNALIKTNASHVRENQNSFFDFKVDNYFYFSFGKIYAYLQIAKAIGYDFKEVLIKHDIYQYWTKFLNLFEQLLKIEPLIIRNAPLNSSFAPNHLTTINFYIANAVNYLNNILNRLP